MVLRDVQKGGHTRHPKRRVRSLDVRGCVVLAASLILVAAGGCSSSAGGGGTEETTETEIKTTYLTTGVEELLESGCITDAGVAASLKAELASSVEAFASAVASAKGAVICEAGATLLAAIAAGDAEPYFEEGRIIFDADGDGCVESLFSTSANTIASADADGDSCFDSLMSFGALLDRLLAAAAQESISRPSEPKLMTVQINTQLLTWVQTLTWHLFPLVLAGDLQQYPDYDFTTYRAMAEDLLDTTIAAVPGTVPNAETASLLTAYLENTHLFVDEFSGCTGTGSDGGAAAQIAPAARSAAKDVTVTRLVCIYANSTHGWLSLEAGSERHARGFYKGTRGKGVTAPPVPTVGKGDSGDGTLGWLVGIENPKGPGYVTEQDKSNSGYRICWVITETQWDTLVNAINADITTAPEYDFFGHNCLGWAAKILALIGKVPPSYTTCGVADPGSMTNKLKEMAEKGEKPEGAHSVEKYDAPPAE